MRSRGICRGRSATCSWAGGTSSRGCSRYSASRVPCWSRRTLLDELVFRVRANADPDVFKQTPPGSFVVARLAPIADWLISGSLAVFPAEDAERLYRVAAQTACGHPAAVFRHPEKLERAWQLQREDRANFIDFFGSDLVVVPGRELAGQLDGYWRDRNRRSRDSEDRDVAPPLPTSRRLDCRRIAL